MSRYIYGTPKINKIRGNVNCVASKDDVYDKLFVYILGCWPAVRDMYKVLTAFVAGMTVQDVCSRLHPRLLGIDERFDHNKLFTCL